MPEPMTIRSAATLAGRDALRIVLFGHPNAGKSSLLGALAESGQTQTDDLMWRLADLSGGLAELRQRLYDNQPQRTTQEIVPYPVAFEAVTGKKGDSPRVPAVLVDCDGQVAIDLLSRANWVENAHPRGSLGRAVLQADALVVLLPVNDPVPVEEDFARLEQFLTLLEHYRGGRSEVSGLPVFLVVSKADLLAGGHLTFADWQVRVEEHLRQLHARFQRFRDRPEGAATSPFGRIDVHLAATAVQLPALADQPAAPRQPHGVAELFRRCIDRARDYRHRWRRSNRGLLVTLLLTAGALGMMAALIFAFYFLPEAMEREADRRAFQSAVTEETTRYQNWGERARGLMQFADYRIGERMPVPWREWNGQVEKLLAESDWLPHRPEDTLPGRRLLRYEAVLQSEPVTQARAEWEKVRERLELVRNLAYALGLLDPEPSRPPLLRVPAPPDFTAEMARGLLSHLLTVYPDCREWTVQGLPAPVAKELADAAQASARNLMDAGQAEVLQRMQRLSPDGHDSPALWRKTRDWLAAPPELREWRELYQIVTGVYQPKPPDPVTVLYTFVARDHFVLELQRLALRIPLDRGLRPQGKLAIYYEGNDGSRTTLLFKTPGEGKREEKAVIHTFIPDRGESLTYQLKYQPGDTFWAELPVRDAEDQRRMLTWSVCHSLAYQFERLVRPPRLHRPDQVPVEGKLMEDVGVVVEAGRIPEIPELMPVVRLGKR